MGDRLDGADAAVVAHLRNERVRDVKGVQQRLVTFDVDQRVKGDVEKRIVVRAPYGGAYDVVVPENEAIGLLLTRAADGAWLVTACSVVEPGELVVAGGEPRGGAIKVVIGLAILGLVLLWARRRLRRGARPDLPGAPEP